MQTGPSDATNRDRSTSRTRARPRGGQRRSRRQTSWRAPEPNSNHAEYVSENDDRLSDAGHAMGLNATPSYMSSRRLAFFGGGKNSTPAFRMFIMRDIGELADEIDSMNRLGIAVFNDDTAAVDAIVAHATMIGGGLDDMLRHTSQGGRTPMDWAVFMGNHVMIEKLANIIRSSISGDNVGGGSIPQYGLIGDGRHMSPPTHSMDQGISPTTSAVTATSPQPTVGDDDGGDDVDTRVSVDMEGGMVPVHFPLVKKTRGWFGGSGSKKV